MPLIICSDCNREVSDRASACPNCGAPISPSSGDSSSSRPIYDDHHPDFSKKVVTTPNFSEQPSKVKEAALMASVAVAMGAAVGISTKSVSASDPAEATGYAIGSAIALLAIPYIVLFFARAKTAWMTLIVMCVLLVIGQWSSYSVKRGSDERQATRALAETGRDALEDQRQLLQKYSQEPVPNPLDAPSATTEIDDESGGAPMERNGSTEAVMLQQLTKLIRDRSAESTEISETIADAVKNLKLEETLSPSELTNAEGIARGREKLAKYSALVDQLEALSKRFADTLDREMRGIARESKYENELLSGFQQGRQERGDLDRLMATNQRSLISTATRILDFMEARLGDTSVEGSQVVFSSTADVETYNGMLTELTALTEEETALTNRLQKLIDRGLKSMDELATSSK